VKLPRASVSARVSVALCSIAALATGLAIVLQSQSLWANLERAAERRLARSADATNRLLDNHLVSLRERYRAVSETPELRANLEVGHAPTLRFFARSLAEREGAAAVAFFDRLGRAIAVAGSRSLTETLLSSRAMASGSDTFLVDHDARVYAVVDVPLHVGDRRLGSMLAAQVIDEAALDLWAELSGAAVGIVSAEDDATAAFSRSARRVGKLAVRVSSSLDAERAALADARTQLLTGGALALVLAFGLSLVVSRSLVGPIQRIQEAIGPIGRGDLGLRLVVERDDEIGDVSRAFNGMLDRLEGTLSALQRSETRLAKAQNLARLGSWSMEPGSDVIACSEEVLSLLWLRATGDTLPLGDVLARLHADDRPRLADALERAGREGRPFRLDQRSVEIGGRQRFLHWQAELVSGDDGTRVEGTIQDITERKLVEEQVRYLANHDPVTGLGNRRMAQDFLRASIQDARATGSGVGVLVIDLDDFKLVNDTFGHSTGDRLLQAVAQRLVDVTVGVSDRSWGCEEDSQPIVARLGGDEFLMVLPQLAGPEEAGRVAVALLQKVAEPVELEGRELVVSGTVGIAAFPADGADVETLLRNGDTAMHHAKERGRNTYQFYSEAMNSLVLKRLLLENKLRRAIEDEHLELQFQPKVDLETGRVQGLEALARWHDPEFGVVSPSDFIPLAEEAGLIEAIGDWVLRAGIAQLGRWADEGLPELRLAVNLSARQLDNPKLPDRIAELLGEAGVDPRRLDLEITETAVLSSAPSTLESLERLRALGCGVALDDFGTGYSSLSTLRTLPIDSLKIDRSFLEDVERDPDAAALLGAIISMAKVLRHRVVVEGVETEGQLAILRELGCDEIQGHLMSPPLVVSEVPRVKREIEDALRKDGPLAESQDPEAPRPPRPQER
jgi:diguanylate cyclase (GGDEF)-like protein